MAAQVGWPDKGPFPYADHPKLSYPMVLNSHRAGGVMGKVSGMQ